MGNNEAEAAALRLFYFKSVVEMIGWIFSILAAAVTIYCALDARAVQRETVAIVDRQAAEVRNLCAAANPITVEVEER